MKTVLMIAPYFPPRRRVGSLRPFKFAIHLRDYDWNPVVLTLDTPGNSLTDHEKKLLDGIDIISVKSPFDRTVKPVKNDLSKSDKSAVSSFIDNLGDWIDKQIPADSWLPLFYLKYKFILKEVNDRQPELIWCTGDPWSGLWLGDKIARDLDLPLISDFRDPWTLANLNLRKRSKLSSSKDEKIERRVLTYSDHVVFTAESTKDKYQKAYEIEEFKCSVIYNSFSEKLSLGAENREWGVEVSPDKFHLLFLGQFRRLSPAKIIIKAIDYLNKQNPAVCKKLIVHSFGELKESDALSIEEYGLQSHFVQHKKVEPEKIESVLKKADMLLLSSHAKRNLIIPAKLWDYIPVDKPILSVSANTEIAEILNETHSGVQFPLKDLSAISDYLATSILKKADGESFSQRNHGKIKKYESDHTTRQLADLMNRISA